MKPLSVLDKEIVLFDKLIAIKQKNYTGPDEWITKTKLAEMQLNNTKTIIETGRMELETYKLITTEELKKEQKLLTFSDMDKIPNTKKLKEIKRRITKKI